MEEPWSIAVKTVGGGFPSEDGNEANGERNFTVTVSPDDGLATLHDQIEGITGLKASQQRLIYRGRLIGRSDNEVDEGTAEDVTKEPRIKDIAGLTDGQTIHLVKKRETPGAESGSSSTEANNASDGANRSSSSSSESEGISLGNGGSGSGSGGSASLLAALLGLGDLGDSDNNDRTTTSTTSTTTTPRQRVGLRQSRLGRSRRPHFRLTADDLEIPDPGTMEPVRQGLMTLHTMVPHARAAEERLAPVEANRIWYRGQWLDCRDTVNQWLEATVVDIVYPDEILPQRPNSVSPAHPPPRRTPNPLTNDPAVSANDFEGRRMLLLEPCDEGDSDEEEGELARFRRRRNNDGVQLLLVHYNGWPHRWDEWIRGDSERIRPFRTRTRHPNVSSNASPTPQSVFNEAPSTNLRDGDESADRTALLPELSRAVTAVNDLLGEALQGATPVEPLGAHQVGELPWLGHEEEAECSDSLPDLLRENADRFSEFAASSNVEEAVEDDDDDDDNNNNNNDYFSVTGQTPAVADRQEPQPQYNRRQLELLAPLLDRLGRTLTDAAPHIAALAATLPESSSEERNEDSSQDDLPDLVGENHAPLSGLLTLLSRDRHSAGSALGARSSFGAVRGSRRIDPDHVDFVSGLVNTHRGEVRSGPRSRSQPDDITGLLGAYLAAASIGGLSSSDDGDNDDNNGVQGLGRLLRERGNGGGGGGGIDIHIHAVVTTPGGGPGGVGFTAFGGGGGVGTTTATTAGARNIFSSTRDRSRGSSALLRSRTPSVSVVDEDDGLFSDLYSENPTPVNPNGSPEPRERHGAARTTSNIEDNSTDGNDYLLPTSSPRTSYQSTLDRSNSTTSSPSRNSRRSEIISDRRANSQRLRRNPLSRLFGRRNRNNS